MKVRKCLSFAVFIVLALTVTSFAAVVEKVTIVQTTGAASSYNDQTKILTWSAGASGMVSTDVGDYSSWDTATLTATFSGITDLSSGGVAAARFTSGTWQFHMTQALGNYNADFKIWGNLNSVYDEAEAIPDQLVGAALANVQGMTWSYDTYAGWEWDNVSFAWANPNNLGSLTASTLFDFNLQGYAGGWQSGNLTGQITSDVPEPGTVSLMALGLAGLLRRKKK